MPSTTRAIESWAKTMTSTSDMSSSNPCFTIWSWVAASPAVIASKAPSQSILILQYSLWSSSYRQDSNNSYTRLPFVSYFERLSR